MAASGAGIDAVRPRRGAGGPALSADLESARRVQARLLPGLALRSERLEVAGRTAAALEIGGDWYDFLEPSSGRLVLAIGDVSGKGVAAALMAAALQACLRSHYAWATCDLVDRLGQIHRQFFACTASNHFASLFVGEYDPANARLRFVNCGHPAGLLVRAGGAAIDRLEPTAPVLGLFEEWVGSTGEIALGEGDLLLLFTDGVGEACGEGGVLQAVVEGGPDRSASDLASAVIARARLRHGRPADDATVVVARAAGR